MISSYFILWSLKYIIFQMKLKNTINAFKVPTHFMNMHMNAGR